MDDHPITVARHDRAVTVRAGDAVIARTDRALALQESTYPVVLYIPIADVDPSVLRPSDRHTFCPYKGQASYYDLVGLDRGEGAVWYYPEPKEGVAEIAGHVAFYPDRVTITG